MSVPNDKAQGKKPAVGKSLEVGGSGSRGAEGPQTYDGRANTNAGTEPNGPFVAYWKTPAKVLRRYGGND